jgi:hypothetical protein
MHIISCLNDVLGQHVGAMFKSPMVGCPETLVNNYQPSPSNTKKSAKSPKMLYFSYHANE